jgi:DNA-binding NarL/FixJ family response regulator
MSSLAHAFPTPRLFSADLLKLRKRRGLLVVTGLLKDVQPGELADAIRLVAAGNSLFGPAATERLLARFATLGEPVAERSLDGLTDRERQILLLIASGCSNAELAQQLHLSETTVKTHVSAVLRKLGVRDRVQAVIAAYEGGLVRPGAHPPTS